MNREQTLRRRIKLLTWFFIVGLVISGATAIPLNWELDVMVNWFGLTGQSSATANSELGRWLLTAQETLQDVSANHPCSSTARIGWRSGTSSLLWPSLARCATQCVIAGCSTSD
ncbi:MAG: hypothetical protein U1F83_11845 [Verrucomicrobiota bacterium]